MPNNRCGGYIIPAVSKSRDPQGLNSVPQFVPEQYLQGLADRLAGLLHHEPRAPGDRLISVSLALPGWRLPKGPTLRHGDFFWSSPDQERRLLARGRAWQQQSAGSMRLSALDRALQRLMPHWRHWDPDGLGREPLALTTAAFDHQDPMQGPWEGLPNALLFVPELMMEQTGRNCRLVLSASAERYDEKHLGNWLSAIEALLGDTQVPPEPAAPTAPPATRHMSEEADWASLAGRALRHIGRGDLEKLVLYRQLNLPVSARSTANLLRQLAAAYPQCRLIALQWADARFVSASPEHLLIKEGTLICSDALAGTVPLDAGNGQSKRMLQEDAKCRHEHELVVRALRDALRPLCNGLASAQEPGVRRLGRLAHLHARVRGQLRDDVSALQLAGRLHPTPAVSGSPPTAALQWLRREGQARRGWYSGFAGWISRNGDAEFNVLLRCALLRGNRAELFAGAGLVAGSQVEAELAETELKLAAVRDLL
jgi:isochorismate synthase